MKTKFEVGDLVKLEIDSDAFDEDDMFDAQLEPLESMFRPLGVSWIVKKITSAACAIEHEGMQSFHRLYVRPVHLIKLYNEMPPKATKGFMPIKKLRDEESGQRLLEGRIADGYYTNTPARIWDKIGAAKMTDDALNAWSKYCDDIRDRAYSCFYDDLIWAFRFQRTGVGPDPWMECISAAKENARAALTWSMEYDHCWWALYNEFRKAYEELQK